MRHIIPFILAVAALGTSPTFAKTDGSPYHSYITIEDGIYNTTKSYFTGLEGGLGYETGPLVHYLFFGAGQVTRSNKSESDSFGMMAISDPEPNLREFELGYRMAHNLNENITMFADFGYETLRGSRNGSDFLGNPTTQNFYSDHYFLGLGMQMKVWRELHLNISCRYMPHINEAAFCRSQYDFLGNLTTINGNTPSFLLKLGLCYQF
jgi:hypothetical protein